MSCTNVSSWLRKIFKTSFQKEISCQMFWSFCLLGSTFWTMPRYCSKQRQALMTIVMATVGHAYRWCEKIQTYRALKFLFHFTKIVFWECSSICWSFLYWFTITSIYSAAINQYLNVRRIFAVYNPVKLNQRLMTFLNFAENLQSNGPISRTNLFLQDCILVIYNIFYYIAHMIWTINWCQRRV